MKSWYFFGGFFVFILLVPYLQRWGNMLPRKLQAVIAVVFMVPCFLGMIWAIWFMYTGRADPSVLADYIKR